MENQRPVVSDVHSFSKPNEARVDHLNLTLQVDFQQKKLFGMAQYKITVYGNAKEIILDTYDLIIKKVFSGNTDLAFELGEKDIVKGSPLIIQLPANCKEIYVQYETTPSAKALQWLTPEQTIVTP